MAARLTWMLEEGGRSRCRRRVTGRQPPKTTLRILPEHIERPAVRRTPAEPKVLTASAFIVANGFSIVEAILPQYAADFGVSACGRFGSLAAASGEHIQALGGGPFQGVLVGARPTRGQTCAYQTSASVVGRGPNGSTARCRRGGPIAASTPPQRKGRRLLGHG